MKRIIYYIATLLLAFTLNAQIVSPLGYGLPAYPEKVTDFEDGLIAVYKNKDDKIELQQWNGDFWFKLQNPSLPELGHNSNGYYEIIDLVEYAGDIYLLTGYTTKLTSNALSSVYKWNGNNWSDVSNNTLSQANVVSNLLVQENKLYCLGKFRSNLKNFNLLEFNGNTWNVTGNTLTQNFSEDKINTTAVLGDKIFVTGNFTQPGQGNYSLATWNGNKWSATEFPPFLGENITLGNFNNSIVVYGKSDFDNESVKQLNGEIWESISAGLENYEINNIQNFAQKDDQLFALGNFTKKSDSKAVEILQYNGTSWEETKLNLSSINKVNTVGRDLILAGDFSDNARINYIGALYTDKAQIAARVYLDKNENCLKDNDEDWISNYPINLNDNTSLQTDIYGQLYLTIDKHNYNLNAEEDVHWKATCPDYKVVADEYKTYYGAIFGINQRVGLSDIEINIADYQSFNFQTGERKKAKLCVKNRGIQPISDAQITLNLGDGISDFTSTRSFTLKDPNTAEWMLNVSGNSEVCFDVEYTITASEETEIIAEAKLKDGITDANATNNKAELKYKTGETLINDKHCANGKRIEEEETQLKYKIGFKNLASAKALDLKIVDELDSSIIISHKGINSITSHTSTLLPVYTLEGNGNYKTKLVWSFTDVNLESSAISASESEGFIDFQINIVPNSIVKGKTICNTAQLYYSYRKGSYDEAITTNTVCSTVGESVGIANPEDETGIEINPNPARSTITVYNKLLEPASLNLTDVLGSSVLSAKTMPLTSIKLDVSELSAGVYFMYSNGTFAKKLIIK